MSDEQKTGIYMKYTVQRTDGSSQEGQKHEKCRYFVLDLNHDPFAKPAILAYARACAKTHPVLAQDLRDAAKVFDFKGGRVGVTMRCIGPQADSNLRRCRSVYSGQEGWDFIGLRPLEGWVCPDCRKRFERVFGGPGLPKPVNPPERGAERGARRAAAFKKIKERSV